MFPRYFQIAPDFLKRFQIFSDVSYYIVLKKTEIKKRAQDSHKAAQDFRAGFENWGLVRTRLAQGKTRTKVLCTVLCKSCAHKASKKAKVLCAQGPRTRPRTRLGKYFAQDLCAYKALA